MDVQSKISCFLNNRKRLASAGEADWGAMSKVDR
jgi:hypothetical protein